MPNLTVASRLGIGFSVIIALVLTVAAIGISNLSLLDTNTRTIETQVEMVGLSNSIITKTNQIAIALRNMLLAENRDDLARQKQAVLDNRASILKDIEKLWPLVSDPHAREILERAKAQRGRYIEGQEKLMATIEAGSADEARRYLNSELRPILLQYQTALKDFNAYQDEQVARAVVQAHEHYGNARNLSIGIVCAALVVSIGLALWVIRSVTGPLGGEPAAAQEVIERIAEGDLTATIPVRDNDAHSLMAATHKMQTSLRRMLAELHRNAEGVATSAQEMATASHQVASATALQSEAASSMAAAVEQMTVSINHVSDSARQAHAVTTQTGELSDAGNQAIEHTVAEMQRISATVHDASNTIREMGESSQRISGIVGVIKDVADQTNLLALNAAIEAARAGEAGRGFAVVADEVRKLAERTAKATTEISEMVAAVQDNAHQAVSTMAESVARVEDGVNLARKSSQSMLSINDGARQVMQTVTDISNALSEQGTASNEIAANVENIAQRSEENSIAVRSVADTAVRLQKLAAESHQAVAAFRI
ncbi:methyl-accepting chemotaxis protein [Dechloromonas sp. XY25]|uniref:Methyl-accepting chemotaxis protein n=1 Tax=Dechloromonas hankyongensis TaxID=2908002 RepID=A0ABS9JZG8_9RHOO|nr:methyl-accepting chemotaxis protein [Dechloromonas hankyongensis]MCG2576305.1 methyl-accepting chemotaxis protein [Dechloromonas hankyongensis]